MPRIHTRHLVDHDVPLSLSLFPSTRTFRVSVSTLHEEVAGVQEKNKGGRETRGQAQGTCEAFQRTHNDDDAPMQEPYAGKVTLASHRIAYSGKRGRGRGTRRAPE